MVPTYGAGMIDMIFFSISCLRPIGPTARREERQKDNPASREAMAPQQIVIVLFILST